MTIKQPPLTGHNEKQLHNINISQILIKNQIVDDEFLEIVNRLA